jgi:hypothetical protein
MELKTGQGMFNPACRTALATPLEVLKCPSDTARRVLTGTAGTLTPVNMIYYAPAGETISVAQTSYKGVSGDNKMSDTSTFTGSAKDCWQGLGCPGFFWRNSFYTPIRFSSVRDGLSNTFLVGEDAAEQSVHTAAYYSNGDYASCSPPLNYFPKPPNPTFWPDVMGFRSLHPGGASFCLADGSVHFVSETIDQTIYRGMATRAGQEVVTLP